jgi:inosose dehydratase
VPLGAGSVDVAEFVAVLERAGYAGWYVLEQDAMLDADPGDELGPVGDVRASLEFLRSAFSRQPTA